MAEERLGRQFQDMELTDPEPTLRQLETERARALAKQRLAAKRQAAAQRTPAENELRQQKSETIREMEQAIDIMNEEKTEESIQTVLRYMDKMVQIDAMTPRDVQDLQDEIAAVRLRRQGSAEAPGQATESDLGGFRKSKKNRKMKSKRKSKRKSSRRNKK